MFTGIVEELGKVYGVRRSPGRMRLDIQTQKAAEGTQIGDSISVNGVCLTVVCINKNILSFEAISETVQITTLKQIRPSLEVNLERALKAGDRLGGHFVTGHIDTIGVIRSKKTIKGNLQFQIGVPQKFLKYLIPKGSIAVDGISLTIADIGKGCFCIRIIPHTALLTTLGKKHSGDMVNIEFDMLAKRS